MSFSVVPRFGRRTNERRVWKNPEVVKKRVLDWWELLRCEIWCFLIGVFKKWKCRMGMAGFLLYFLFAGTCWLVNTSGKAFFVVPRSTYLQAWSVSSIVFWLLPTCRRRYVKLYPVCCGEIATFVISFTAMSVLEYHNQTRPWLYATWHAI